jgi:uncharacterized protein YjgD (DUF1641 family)
MTTLAPDQTPRLEAKVDLLAEQMAILTEEATIERQRRQAWDELRDDLAPIATEVMDYAGRELEDITSTSDLADLVSLARQLARSAGTIERSLRALDAVDELASDVVPVATAAVAKATSVLAQAEEAGYVGFARSSMGVVDKVVTSFSGEDVDRLGDNIVSILEMVKELTQPEMVALFTRMIEAVERQHDAIEGEPEHPPSLWQLARQVRDPDVRRGMGRALNTLRAVSAETGPTQNQSEPPREPNEKGAA